MAKKIILAPSSAPGIKDERGVYLKADPPPELSEPPTPKFKSHGLDLEEMLNGQILALGRATKSLLEKSVTGLNKDDVASLATCIKLTIELRAKETELLSNLSDAELEEIAKS